MKLDIKEIINATGANVLLEGSIKEITSVSTDSRNIKNGDLFIAIEGPHFDGHNFVEEVLKNGASGVIVNKKLKSDKLKGWVLKTKDTVHSLGDIAACWRKHISSTCVAVTGSNGKSTTKEMIAVAIEETRSIIKTEGNFNNLIGLPLQVMRISKEHEVAVLEMGMNAVEEIKRLTEIAAPDIGLITNVNPAHLEKLHTIENVASAKGELFDTMRRDGTVVINVEDPWVLKLGNKYPGRKITFGMQNGCNVQFGRMVAEGLDEVDLTFYVNGREYAMRLPLPGWHNVMNALAAISVGVALGLRVPTMIGGLENMKAMKMRMERMQLINGVQLINDTYNANPASMYAALRTVGAAKRAGRFIAVFGDMLELGEVAPEKHNELGKNAAVTGVNKLFIMGTYAEEIAKGARENGLRTSDILVMNDLDKLAKQIKNEIKTGDIVLIKGSRGMKMERVVEYLKNEIGV